MFVNSSNEAVASFCTQIEGEVVADDQLDLEIAKLTRTAELKKLFKVPDLIKTNLADFIVSTVATNNL